MTHPGQYFTEQQAKDFNRAVAEGSKKLGGKQPRPPKHRHSSEILADMDRQKLGLKAASHRLKKAEQSLADATGRLARHKDRLAELKASRWYTRSLNEVKNLVGWDTNDQGINKHIKGLIEVAEEDVARGERDVPLSKASVETAKKELAKSLKSLNTELAEAYKVEGRTSLSRGATIAVGAIKGRPSAYDQRMAEVEP